MFEGKGTGSTRQASGNPDRPYDEINLSTEAFWSTTMDEREKSFAVLRRERPITWQPPMEENLLPVGCARSPDPRFIDRRRAYRQAGHGRGVGRSQRPAPRCPQPLR
jgi:hypothetical protein